MKPWWQWWRVKLLFASAAGATALDAIMHKEAGTFVPELIVALILFLLAWERNTND